jgi:hypothetical protein
MPCLNERDPGIVDHLAIRISRGLLVTGREGKRGMGHVAVDIVDLQPPATGFERRCGALGAMVSVPRSRASTESSGNEARRELPYLYSPAG